MKILMMVISFFLVLQCLTAGTSFAKAVKATEHRGRQESVHLKKRNHPLLEILPFEAFRALPDDKMKSYLLELREFISQQETHWEGSALPPGVPKESSKRNHAQLMERVREFFSLLEVTAAQAQEQGLVSEDNYLNYFRTDGRCVQSEEEVGNLKSGPVKWMVENGQDKCLMGGVLICLTIREGKLLCSASHPQFAALAQDHKCKDEEIFCEGPAYISNDSNASIEGFCAAGYTSGSVSKFCAKNSAPLDKPETLAKLKMLIEKNPKAAKYAYERQRKTLTDYCGDKGEKAHAFDKGDCTALQARLDAVESSSGLFKAKAGSFICSNIQDVYGKNNKNLLVKLYAKSETEVKIEKYGSGAKDWTTTRCNVLGLVDDKQIDGNGSVKAADDSSNCGMNLCLARYNLDSGTYETLTYPYSSCNVGNLSGCDLVHRTYRSGSYDNKGNCTAKLGGDYDSAQYDNSSNKAVYKHFDGHNMQDVSLSEEDYYSTLKTTDYWISGDSKTIHGLLVNKESKGCTVYYQDRTSPTPETPAQSKPVNQVPAATEK